MTLTDGLTTTVTFVSATALGRCSQANGRVTSNIGNLPVEQLRPL